MPTTEERLTALETAVADAQVEILKRAKTSEVNSIEAARDGIKSTHDTEHTSYEDRLAKLERMVAIILKTQLDLYKKDANEQLPEDIVWAVHTTTGPVLKSPNGTKYRIVVANGGALSTSVVP